MKMVCRFPIHFGPTTGTLEMGMPEGAEILCVQMQDTGPTIWALVDPMRPTSARRIIIVGTDHGMPKQDYDVWRVYIGTFQWPMMEGSLVFHVFEDLPS